MSIQGSKRALLAGGALLASLCSCKTTLHHEPWSQINKGTTSLGASTGWAIYEADVSVQGKNGVLAPGGVGEVGSDGSDLTPNYGGAIKLNHFITDRISLGGIVELRSFDVDDPIMPLTAELEADEFETWHFLLSSRYWFDPVALDDRVKPFFGIDLGYIPDVQFDRINVTYPASTGIPSETISAEGSEYWTIAPVVGFSYLLYDNVTLDFGAFYEFPLTESEATISFPNLGGAEADARVEARGLIAACGISIFF